MIADLYDWLLFGHIVGAMVWVGSLATLTVLSMQVRRSGEPEAIGRFVRGLRSIGPALLAPAVVLVFVLGVWMVSDSAEWALGQRWVRIALILFAVAFLIGASSRAGLRSSPSAGSPRAITAKPHASCGAGRGGWAPSLYFCS